VEKADKCKISEMQKNVRYQGRMKRNVIGMGRRQRKIR